MRIIRVLKFLYKSEHPHFISVDKETYFRWKWIIKIAVGLNKEYKSCEIFRKEYKMMKDFVVVGLKRGEKPTKRRTSGYAKGLLDKNPGSKCIYCETQLTIINVTTDHIIPISNFGNNCQVNLLICCKNCNNERGNIEFNEYLHTKNPKYLRVKRLFI